MSKKILQSYVECNRKRGRPKKNWLNDIFEYSQSPSSATFSYCKRSL